MANMKLRLYSGNSSERDSRVGYMSARPYRERQVAERNAMQESRFDDRGMRDESRYDDRDMRGGSYDMRERARTEASRMNRSELEMNYAEMCARHDMMAERMRRIDPGFAETTDKLEPMLAVVENTMPSMMGHIEKIIANPPETWDKYMSKGDIRSVIEMEGGEFLDALEKAESVEALAKEATHVMAAVLMYCLSKR